MLFHLCPLSGLQEANILRLLHTCSIVLVAHTYLTLAFNPRLYARCCISLRLADIPWLLLHLVSLLLLFHIDSADHSFSLISIAHAEANTISSPCTSTLLVESTIAAGLTSTASFCSFTIKATVVCGVCNALTLGSGDMLYDEFCHCIATHRQRLTW